MFWKVFHMLSFRGQWDIQVKMFGGLKCGSGSFHIEGTGGNEELLFNGYLIDRVSVLQDEKHSGD